MTSQRVTEEIPAVAFTDEHIAKGLSDWSASLAKAKAAGDIFAADTALDWINTWLDRQNRAHPPAVNVDPVQARREADGDNRDGMVCT